jgi:short-subunit dehydrogenase
MLSILSRVALPLMESLCVSKAAALRFAEGVRAELNVQDTWVAAVIPGAVDTDLSKGFSPPKNGARSSCRNGARSDQRGC